MLLGSKQFFFEKKNQKTFASCRSLLKRGATADQKSFASFLQKRSAFFLTLKDQLIAARRRRIAQSGKLARLLLFPRPGLRPYQRPLLNVARKTGIGDVIMCTAVLRAAKQANPHGHIRFYTGFPELAQGLPYIDEVLPFDARVPGSIYLEYEKTVPTPVHLTRLMGDRIGVEVTDPQPDCVIDGALVEAYQNAWRHLPRPWVIVLRRASRYTPNKDWPNANWDELVARVAVTSTLIEIGDAPDAPSPIPVGNYIDLRGQTTLTQLTAAISAADIHVGPVSGPMHIAGAAGTPTVVIIGGYEHPVNAHYEGNVEFYTQVPCAPCWLRTPCPFDVKCLRAIGAGEVFAAIAERWETASGRMSK